MQTTTTAAAAATHDHTHGHTPGPWMWDDNTLRPANPNPDTSSVHSILDAEGGYGFLGSDVQKTIAELDADRVLIAAAPELLEALQRLHACMQAQDLEAEAKRPTEDEYQACMAAAAAAIAKATRKQDETSVQREVRDSAARPAGHGGLFDAQGTKGGVWPAAGSGQVGTAATITAPTLGVVLRKAPQLIALVLHMRLCLLRLRTQIGVLALQRPDALTQKGQVLAQHRRRAALVDQRLNLFEQHLKHFILQKPVAGHGSEGGAA